MIEIENPCFWCDVKLKKLERLELILSCGHSFHLKCLSQLLASYSERQVKQDIVCPLPSCEYHFSQEELQRIKTYEERFAISFVKAFKKLENCQLLGMETRGDRNLNQKREVLNDGNSYYRAIYYAYMELLFQNHSQNLLPFLQK
jgi:hypothetical protein